MKLIKKILFGAALTMAAAASQAAFINVGGVVFDPTSTDPVDFASNSASIRQTINADGSLLGFGVITTINGTDQSVFCPSCQLTFVFSGYTPLGMTTTPSPGIASIPYANGFVNVYVNSNSSTFVNASNPFNYTASQFGAGVSGNTLFLGLSGHINPTFTDYPGTTFKGLITTDDTVTPNVISELSGRGLVDVMAGAAGGIAAANFDTNGRAFGSDLAFSATFTDVRAGGADSTGAGTFVGDSIAVVPEPASLALAGLGLMCLGFVRRRKA